MNGSQAAFSQGFPYLNSSLFLLLNGHNKIGWRQYLGRLVAR